MNDYVVLNYDQEDKRLIRLLRSQTIILKNMIMKYEKENNELKEEIKFLNQKNKILEDEDDIFNNPFDD